MKATPDKKQNADLEEEAYYNYFTRQKQYLEIIYFQFIRNLKIDNFSRLSFYYFLDISEYLSSKIFNILDKNQTNQLSLEEFISGTILIFSKYFPENGKALTNIIFNLISDNSENFNYEKITEFFNHIISEISIKSKMHNYEFYTNLTKKLRDYITKIFGITAQNVKTIKFTKKDFLKVIEKNPSLINLIILLLNLLTPINEKLVSKLAENSVKVSLNDDFEDEYEVDSENEESKPKVNSIPVSFMEAHNVLKNNSFDRSYNEKTIEKIELRRYCDKEGSGVIGCESSFSGNTSNYLSNKERGKVLLNNSCGNGKNSNFNFLSSDNSVNNNSNCSSNNNNNNNLINLNNMNLTGNNVCLASGNKSNQKDDSTDVSDVSGNKLSNLKMKLKPNSNKAYNNNSLENCIDNNDNIPDSKNLIPKIKISNDEVFKNEFADKETTTKLLKNNANHSFNEFITNSKGSATKSSFEKAFSSSTVNNGENNCIINNSAFAASSTSMKKTSSNLQNLSNNINDLINSSYSNSNSNSNSKINNNNEESRESKTKTYRTPKEYNLGSDRNTIIPIKNYKIIKSLEKEENLFSDIMLFYRELKSKSTSSSTENPNDNGVQFSNPMVKKNFRILFSKNLTLEKAKYIANLEDFCPLIIKIIESDLLLIQQNLKTNKNESIHFINIKNLYLDTKISFENNEFYFNYNGSDLKYYVLSLHHFKQVYNILFESYNEMDSFLNILQKQISSLLGINLPNYRLIFKTINFIESKKKPVCIHEINDLSANRILKLQTFKKDAMKEDHLVFFKKINDLCKMNKFLKANLFPVSNIYENLDFVLVEYVDNDFKINYDKKENNFTISLKKVEMSSFIKDEVIKYKKIIKALNNKKFVSSVYELIDMQGLVGIKK